MNHKVKALIEELKAPHFRIREKAVGALMELRSEARDAIPMLLETLKDRSWRVRAASARALGLIGSCTGVDDELRDKIATELINAMVIDSMWNVALAGH